MDVIIFFRLGICFVGNVICVDFFGVEWYLFYCDVDLKDFKIVDMGDLDLLIGVVEDVLDIVYEVIKIVINDGKKLMVIGGEYLIIYFVLKVLYEKYNDLYVIYLDVYIDLCEEFFGRELFYVIFMR